MDGCDFDPREPGWGRDTRAEDCAAVRSAVAMAVAGLVLIVCVMVLVGLLRPVEVDPVPGWRGPEVAL